jgi:hypothetical protein
LRIVEYLSFQGLEFCVEGHSEGFKKTSAKQRGNLGLRGGNDPKVVGTLTLVGRLLMFRIKGNINTEV